MSTCYFSCSDCDDGRWSELCLPKRYCYKHGTTIAPAHSLTMPEKAIHDLQLALLTILRGEHRAKGAWYSRAAILGFNFQWAPLRPVADGMDRVKELRTRILELDPAACIYPTWGGLLPDGYVMPKTYWERKREVV